MNLWLILTPSFAWLAAGTFGIGLIRTRPETMWKGLFSTFTSTPPPYDPDSIGHRFQGLFWKTIGWSLVAAATFVTIMSILVAVGAMPPASN